MTGGSRGLGAAIAQALAGAGADVGLIGRDASALDATRRRIEQTRRQCQCHVVEADLATVDGARGAGLAALAVADTWDILVNNAGTATPAPLLETAPQNWERTFAVNARAALVLSQVLVPQMLRRKRGKIVNVASLQAFLATPNLGAYAASKSALIQLTRTMAVEWGPYNVQANAVCPTLVMIERNRALWADPRRRDQRMARLARIPAGRFGDPRDIVGVVLFLVGPTADFVNGRVIPVDGGFLATS